MQPSEAASAVLEVMLWLDVCYVRIIICVERFKIGP